MTSASDRRHIAALIDEATAATPLTNTACIALRVADKTHRIPDAVAVIGQQEKGYALEVVNARCRMVEHGDRQRAVIRVVGLFAGEGIAPPDRVPERLLREQDEPLCGPHPAAQLGTVGVEILRMGDNHQIRCLQPIGQCEPARGSRADRCIGQRLAMPVIAERIYGNDGAIIPWRSGRLHYPRAP